MNEIFENLKEQTPLEDLQQVLHRYLRVDYSEEEIYYLWEDINKLGLYSEAGHIILEYIGEYLRNEFAVDKWRTISKEVGNEYLMHSPDFICDGCETLYSKYDIYEQLETWGNVLGRLDKIETEGTIYLNFILRSIEDKYNFYCIKREYTLDIKTLNILDEYEYFEII